MTTVRLYDRPFRAFGDGKAGFTFVEIMIAVLILAALLAPVYQLMNSAVRETERFYVEAVAISQAKFAMDTLMFQIPWRAIRAGNPARFEDPKAVPAVRTLLESALPRMFGSGIDTPTAGVWRGDGLLTDAKGFIYRVRLACLDLDDVELAVDVPGKGLRSFLPNDLTPKDADGNHTVMKKLILEIRWSLLKGVDPLQDPHVKTLHLVGIKSHLDG
ncbi:MAG TPA: prepilin-type N-terminal cleavage/methylation domain-containing protein [Candidatus Ozemobacteraceae bacterium]|nr:prepilin-type N-terminal cleavage/methylation domain-containing protein [Candidatus Ozemobacteraceae bacterium]